MLNVNSNLHPCPSAAVTPEVYLKPGRTGTRLAKIARATVIAQIAYTFAWKSPWQNGFSDAFSFRSTLQGTATRLDPASLSVVEFNERQVGTQGLYIDKGRALLLDLYEAWGKKEQADPWRDPEEENK